MKQLFLIITLCISALQICAQSVTSGYGASSLRFDAANFTEKELTLRDGGSVKYRAYENIFFVTNVEDSVYQTVNIFIPENADSHSPIFLKTNIGGYMAAKAGQPTERDATARALQEGFVVVIPGSRGSNSKVGERWTGKAPAGLLDLKAVIRYLRFNDLAMQGDAERIITDGTSAGGAMSSLLGATGNHPAYKPYLQAMGAADARDNIFAAVCFCPITDLDHSDMAYEWLYQATNKGVRALSDEQIAISAELAAQYPAYLNGLKLQSADGQPLTDANYLDYLKSYLIKSANKAFRAGGVMPDNAGITLENEAVTDINLPKYLEYVVTKQPLKSPPAFDMLGVIAGSRATPENQVFGDENGQSANFTEYALRKATGNSSATLDPAIAERVRLMNPMNFIGDKSSTVAPNWYIRHGANDRDTGFQIALNLHTKLVNAGFNPDFAFAWGKPHTGDYDLDELFEWIKGIV